METGTGPGSRPGWIKHVQKSPFLHLDIVLVQTRAEASIALEEMRLAAPQNRAEINSTLSSDYKSCSPQTSKR